MKNKSNIWSSNDTLCYNLVLETDKNEQMWTTTSGLCGDHLGIQNGCYLEKSNYS
jgi:hypothetical protein